MSMIRTIFEEHESSMAVERMMPYPVRVGDRIDLDDGLIWKVTQITWAVDPKLVDQYGASYVTLLVRIK